MKPITINDLIKHLQEAADKFGGDKEVVFWNYRWPSDDLILCLTEGEISYSKNVLNLQLRYKDWEKNVNVRG
jgi:hypothetical protein